MDVCGIGFEESCDLSEFLRPHPGIMHNNVQPNLPSTNTEFKGGLHAYIWKKEPSRPTVKDLKALFKKKEIITDAIMTILIAGEYDL